MADKNGFPQIPSTVWWGVRAILHRSPTATVDERMLSVSLGVQEAAARQYIAELRRASILNEENKATSLAQRWRLDESYADAVDEIMASTYPEGLLQVAPPGEADRQKVVNWFLREGLGQGAAGNKAATYLLIGSREPNEAPNRNAGKPKSEATNKPAAKRAAVSKAAAATTAGRSEDHSPTNGGARLRAEAFPLNVNVQIHISADAGAEQIETIFAAMRRYLHDDPAR